MPRHWKTNLNRAVLLPFCLLCLCGCRTYLGYENVIATVTTAERQQLSAQETGLDAALDIQGTTCRLTFYDRVLETWEDTQETRETGRSLFFQESKYGPLLRLLTLPVSLPVAIVLDCQALSNDSASHYRDHQPDALTRLAYAPPVSWLLFPFIRPPYAGDVRNEPVTSEFQPAERPKLISQAIQPFQKVVWRPHAVNGELLLHWDNGPADALLPHVFPITDGVVAFDLKTLGLESIRPPRILSFRLEIRPDGKTMALVIPSLLTPEILRDWNEMAHPGNDFPFRIRALIRLKPLLTDEDYQLLFQQIRLGAENAIPTFPSAHYVLLPIFPSGTGWSSSAGTD